MFARGTVFNTFLDYAPLITALVAVGGLGATFWKQMSDQNSQRTRDRKQRKTESKRRLEDRFATILTELGSEATGIKAGAAASLVTYLEPQHSRFHHQVRLAVLTNLKFPQEEPIRKLLARVYVQALRSEEPINQFERDLSRAQLANTDFSAVDLPEADLAFANLRDSNLLGSNLARARGWKVVLEGSRLCPAEGRAMHLNDVRFKGALCYRADFSGAVLVNAHLELADLRDARFYGARLQAAHLEEAKLHGAQFQQANLADAYFFGAEFDGACMRSITRAVNWRKGHFDPEVRLELERLAAREG